MPRRVVVIEPHPSAEISALAAKGVRLNPSPKDIGAVDTLVVAVKPQIVPRGRRDAEAVRRTVDAGGLDHGGHDHRLVSSGLRRQRGSRHAEHAGRDRPRHHGRGRGEECQRRAARDRRCAVARHRIGRMGRRRKPDGRGDRGLRLRSGLCLPARRRTGARRRRGRPAGGARDQARARNRRRLRRIAASLGACPPPRCARTSPRPAAPRPRRWKC